MVITYTQEHTYHHPWHRVTAASWLKFTDPSARPILSHISDVHTLRRHVDPPTSQLHTLRSLTIHPPKLPLPLRPLLPPSLLIHSLESSVVDPRNESMQIVTRNLTLRGLIEVEEVSIYEPHEERPEEWTSFRQETRIRCMPLKALARVAEKVEQRCAERFLVNSAKGREVVERICGILEKEGSGGTVSC